MNHRQFLTRVMRIAMQGTLIASTAAFALTTIVWADTATGTLADQIEHRVRQSTAFAVSPSPKASVAEFEQLAVAASWKEVWPDAKGGETTRSVEGKIWNVAIQATLAKHGSVFLPKRDVPYYIDAPIVLRSNQRFCADPKAEIRLVPGTNTCMIRNEHIVGSQTGPVPSDSNPDVRILIEGGIWTTLATNSSQSNGNTYGRSAKHADTPGCHGVILINNVRGALIRNLTIRQSRAHGIQVSNASEFLVERITFDDHGRDGVHMNGPVAYGVIRGIRGDTDDDFIAINAWDWRNAAPCFGPITHLLIEDIYGDTQHNGTAEMRLLPGTKTFTNGRKLDCPIADCVLRKLYDIRTVKIYDQPNLELGRNNDFSDPIGTVRNVYFGSLSFNRPGRFQIAANIDGLTIDGVQLNIDLDSANLKGFALVEIGPMSATAMPDPNDPKTWVELFSPDRDVTVRQFRLTNVHVKAGDGTRSLPDAETRLIRIANQKPNPDYPKTTPRGGTGKVIMAQ
jgi:hypothetical protein